MKVTMLQTKETKGAFMFTELMADGTEVPTVADGAIGQLYIRKASEIGKLKPARITVEVTAVA